MNIVSKVLNRKVINDPKLQFGITSFFVGLGAVNLLFFVVLLKVLHSRVLSEIDQIGEEQRRFLLPIFNELSGIVFQSMVLFGSFILIFSFISGILVLQHISGPSFAFKKFLTQFLNGEKPRYPMKLRKYDIFVDQADLLNALYEKYEIKNKTSSKPE